MFVNSQMFRKTILRICEICTLVNILVKFVHYVYV